mmetsp:Transcript_8630/g.38080  ORF Transcript_8630/g.38080 Transcript_8630/m.38080 type:complete len:474 (+) Transcript_8630:129-1550(+)
MFPFPVFRGLGLAPPPARRLEVLAAQSLLQRQHRLFRVRSLRLGVLLRVRLILGQTLLHLLVLPLERLRHLRLVLLVHGDDLRAFLLAFGGVLGVRFLRSLRGELTKRVNLLRQRGPGSVRRVHHRLELRLPRRRLLPHLLEICLLLGDALGLELRADGVALLHLVLSSLPSLLDASLRLDLRRSHLPRQRRLLLLELRDGDLPLRRPRLLQRLGVLDERGELRAHRLVQLRRALLATRLELGVFLAKEFLLLPKQSPLLVRLVRLALLLGGGHLGDRRLVRRLRLDAVLGKAQDLALLVRQVRHVLVEALDLLRQPLRPRRRVLLDAHGGVFLRTERGRGLQPVRDQYPRHGIDAEHNLARRRQRRWLAPLALLGDPRVGILGEEIESRVALSLGGRLAAEARARERAVGALVLPRVALERVLEEPVRGRLRLRLRQPAVFPPRRREVLVVRGELGVLHRPGRGGGAHEAAG